MTKKFKIPNELQERLCDEVGLKEEKREAVWGLCYELSNLINLWHSASLLEKKRLNENLRTSLFVEEVQSFILDKFSDLNDDLGFLFYGKHWEVQLRWNDSDCWLVKAHYGCGQNNYDEILVSAPWDEK